MTSAIILAAGFSTRMGGVNKQLAELCGIPVFVMSALRFERSENVGEIIIAAPKGCAVQYADLVLRYGVTKLKAVTEGGATRFLSVKNALAQVSREADFIAIHDGARPLITTEEIDRVILDAYTHGAAIAAIPATDTVKTVTDGFVTGTPDRSGLCYAQTPQVFKKALYLRCIEKLCGAAESVTDDSSVLEMCGERVYLTEIHCANMKITRPEDIAAAAAIFAQRRETL